MGGACEGSKPTDHDIWVRGCLGRGGAYRITRGEFRHTPDTTIGIRGMAKGLDYVVKKANFLTASAQSALTHYGTTT